MNTVTIDLHEYNKLRDRDRLLTDLEMKRVVVHRSYWNGYIVTKFENMTEAHEEFIKELASANQQLQMRTEEVQRLKDKLKSKWF